MLRLTYALSLADARGLKASGSKVLAKVMEITAIFSTCSEIQRYGMQLLGRLCEEGVNVLIPEDMDVVNAVLNLDNHEQMGSVVNIITSALAANPHSEADFRAFSQVLAGIVRINESAKKGVISAGLHKWIYTLLRGLREAMESLSRSIKKDIHRFSHPTLGSGHMSYDTRTPPRDEDYQRFLSYEDLFASTIRILRSITLLCNTKDRAKLLFSAGIFEPVSDMLKCCSDNVYYLPSTQFFDVSLYVRVQMEALQAALSLAHNRENLITMLSHGGQTTLEDAADNLRKLAKDLISHLDGADVDDEESKFIVDVDQRINLILRQKTEMTDCSVS